MDDMTIDEFQALPQEAVARLVRESGPKVCVFAINGTRRWFMLEHAGQQPAGSLAEAYVQVAGRRHIELYKLFFDHGIECLLTPIVGPDVLERQGYDAVARLGLTWFASSLDFLDFYQAYDVRVRVYGDTQRALHNTPYADVLPLYEELARRTAAHRRHRLFYGIFAHDATQAVAEIAVGFFQQHGTLPSKRQIVEAYYGDHVPPVDLFIGFDRPAAFDMPLVATGRESLYFTVAPSPYLNRQTLRAILYDHMIARQVNEDSYAQIQDPEWARMRTFYQLHRHQVLGIGRKLHGIWYPLPWADLAADL